MSDVSNNNKKKNLLEKKMLKIDTSSFKHKTKI